MAVYKVPQDVEAEDKLIGPFSFRQFIYLIIVAIAGFLAYILSQLFLPLLIIPLPVMIFFGAIALPLKKDQPMETYLAAVVRFFFKPKKRLWQPDGQVDLVEIVVPKVIEEQLSKNISQDDAQSRFDYLAQVMDSRGWSTRGVQSANDSVNEIVAAEAEATTDILDSNNYIAQTLDDRLVQQEQQRRQETMERMQHMPVAPPVTPATAPFPISQPPNPSSQPPIPSFDPYPTMHQRVLTPEGELEDPSDTQAPQVASLTAIPTAAPVPTPVSPDILKLANNNELSISAIAHEAHRLQDQNDGHEVVISWR